MTFTSIEWIALVLIVVGLIKVFILLVNPKLWMNFAKRIYSKPKITSFVSLVLSLVVLYYLVDSGMTIVQILAASAFFSLLLLVGLASEASYLVKKYEGVIKKGNLWKNYWLYTLIWVALLVLGLIAIFG